MNLRISSAVGYIPRFYQAPRDPSRPAASAYPQARTNPAAPLAGCTRCGPGSLPGQRVGLSPWVYNDQPPPRSRQLPGGPAADNSVWLGADSSPNAATQLGIGLLAVGLGAYLLLSMRKG